MKAITGFFVSIAVGIGSILGIHSTPKPPPIAPVTATVVASSSLKMASPAESVHPTASTAQQAAPVEQAQKSQKFTFTSNIGGFSANFGGEPVATSSTVQSVIGPITAYSFTRIASPVSFQVRFFTIPSQSGINFTDSSDGTLNANLQMALQSTIQNNKGQLVSALYGSYEGYPSVDYLMKISSDDTYIKGRVFIVQNATAYVVGTKYSAIGDTTANSAVAQAFLDSLAVIQK